MIRALSCSSGAGVTPVRRSRKIDLLLLAIWLPLFVVLFTAGIEAYRASGGNILPFRLTGAQGANGYPLVASLRVPHPAIQPGDRLIRLGGIDLEGLSRAEVDHRTRAILRSGEPFLVEGERGDESFAVEAEPARLGLWWLPFPTWVAYAVVGTFLLLRAPHWHLSRLSFLGFLGWACFGGAFGPIHPAGKIIAYTVAFPLAQAASLLTYLSWAEAWPPGRWERLLPWMLGISWCVANALDTALAYPTGSVPNSLVGLLSIATGATCLAALVRGYRRSDPLERRKLRVILYLTFVAVLPIVGVAGTEALMPELDENFYPIGFSLLGLIALSYVVAVVGYGWLDIDRVISASAAATALGVALVGGLLTVVPSAAALASTTIGVDPETGRLALSMALAAVLVPAYRRLRPWVDRTMFAEQHELALRFEKLRAEIGSARGVEEMARLAGEGFEALMRPESVAIYGRAGDAFTPLFLRGRALPPAFEASSMLVQVLEQMREPLFARSKKLGPFERAALETLGAEVVVPQLRGDQLVAFTCLGAKKSGDIYTATDLGLLASVAERCSEVIERIDLETLANESRSLQSALRRYVPGAVAERVLAGDALEPTECEVTVMFVDIRGYTGLAERLAAEDVFATLNEHTERVSQIVQENGGTIVEFSGDGLMAVFGAPEELAKKERHAVEAARTIVDSMPEHLAVGVGVATGPAFVGCIRSTDRLIWSAVGSTTNLAARLQALTRELDAGIALDETTRERAGYVCADFVRHERVAIRGRTERVDVFALPLHPAQGRLPSVRSA